MIVEHYRKSLESRLEGYEALLSKQKYIAGDVSIVQTIPRCDHGW